MNVFFVEIHHNVKLNRIENKDFRKDNATKLTYLHKIRISTQYQEYMLDRLLNDMQNLYLA